MVLCRYSRGGRPSAFSTRLRLSKLITGVYVSQSLKPGFSLAPRPAAAIFLISHVRMFRFDGVRFGVSCSSLMTSESDRPANDFGARGQRSTISRTASNKPGHD